MNIPNTIPLLDVRDLTVEFQTRRGIVRAVQNVDVTVAKGETVGDRWRVRLRQIGNLLRGDAHPRSGRADRGRFGDVLRH